MLHVTCAKKSTMWNMQYLFKYIYMILAGVFQFRVESVLLRISERTGIMGVDHNCSSICWWIWGDLLMFNIVICVDLFSIQSRMICIIWYNITVHPFDHGSEVISKFEILVFVLIMFQRDLFNHVLSVFHNIMIWQICLIWLIVCFNS